MELFPAVCPQDGVVTEATGLMCVASAAAHTAAGRQRCALRGLSGLPDYPVAGRKCPALWTLSLAASTSPLARQAVPTAAPGRRSHPPAWAGSDCGTARAWPGAGLEPALGAVMTTKHRRLPDRPPRHAATANGDQPAGDRAALDLPALRAAVLTRPTSAPRLLRRLLPDPPELGETGGRVDVRILLAEALLRSGEITAALRAALDARHAAERLHPSDNRRRLCAYGVEADTALYAGVPATAAYHSYLDQLTVWGHRRGYVLRTVYATAGLAVATCREINRDRGLQLLWDLCKWSYREQGQHHAVTNTLVAGFAALRDGCSACGSRTPGRRTSRHAVPVVPLPGAILQPDLAEPDPTYLASRVHDCPWASR